MQLIDADALLEKMKRRCEYVGRPSDPVCLVEDAPTIDAAPVVRCKDCCWRGMDNCPMEFFWDNHPTDDEVFCSFGKARMNGENND